MVKLLLWPLALAAAAWKTYQWVKNAQIDWALPFEDVGEYRWRN